MTTFFETRDTRQGTFTMVPNAHTELAYVNKAKQGFMANQMQFEITITTADQDQANGWKEVFSNLKVSENVSRFTLKRPSFLGAPVVVNKDNSLMSMEDRAKIGNGSICDVKVSHKTHPKSGTPYVCLEAIRVLELVPFVPNNMSSYDEEDFDF